MVGEENREKFSEEATDENLLAVAFISVHETIFYALVNTGTMSNVMSPALVTSPRLKRGKTKTIIKVANGSRAELESKLVQVPVHSEGVAVKTDSVVLKDAAFFLFIGQGTLKRLRSVLDFRSEVVRLDYRKKESVLPMVLEYGQPRFEYQETDSEVLPHSLMGKSGVPTWKKSSKSSSSQSNAEEHWKQGNKSFLRTTTVEPNRSALNH